MKRTFLLIITMVFLINIIKSQDTMYVHQNDGLLIKIAINNIDSIIFYATDISNNSEIKDIEGNTYKVISIGEQVWMAENLKTTKYNDGSIIPLVTNNSSWFGMTTPAYCWYNNDSLTNKATYGALYNWYTVNTNKLCPTNWHVPSDAEWTILTDNLGGQIIAGGKLKEIGITHWLSINVGATNEVGFSALPSGARNNDGSFDVLGIYSYMWSVTENIPNSVWFRSIKNNENNVVRGSNPINMGMSVRCIKN